LIADESSPAASAFVCFGTNKPVRQQHFRQQQQSFVRPVPNTPVPLPSSKKATTNGHADPATREDSQELPHSALQSQLDLVQDSALLETPTSAHSGSAGEAEIEDVQAPSEGLASRSTSATAISEAPQTSDLIKVTPDDVSPDSSGKVRGPNGRFMSKEEARLMTIARSKSGKKCMC
jgi:hypothetical protein